MKLVVTFLKEIDRLEDIVFELKDESVLDVVVLNGMNYDMESRETMMFDSLRNLLDFKQEENRVILTLVKDDDVKKVLDKIEQIAKLKTVSFCVDVSNVHSIQS